MTNSAAATPVKDDASKSEPTVAVQEVKKDEPSKEVPTTSEKK